MSVSGPPGRRPISSRPWPGLGRRTEPPDQELLAEQVAWLRDKADRQQARIAGLEYSRRATLARAVAAALVIGQLVLLCVPWWVLRQGSSDREPRLAGPWTLLGDAGGFDEDIALSVVLLAVLPLLVYAAALVGTVLAVFGDQPRRTVASSILCGVATVTATAQVTLIAGLQSDNGATYVEATAAGLTAIGLWIAATVATGMFAGDQ